MDSTPSLKLLAPDYGRLDTIWRQPLPFVLWPIGPKSLLGYWMDEAVRRNASKVIIYAPDRPAEIRRYLEGGNYWSKGVEIIPLSEEGEFLRDAIRLDGLPWSSSRASVQSPEGLLRRWLELQADWLEARHSHEVTIDVEKMPQGWLGPGVFIHPDADLRPPFWIGGRTTIGAKCRIGPMAVIHPGCLLDTRVEVEQAIILPDTYLGQNTRLHEAAAEGPVLIDIKRGSRVEIQEAFILGSRISSKESPSIFARFFALLTWLLIAPIASVWSINSWERETYISGGELIPLATGKKGPLLVRRWPWLKAIVSGRLHWLGPLPRTKAQAASLPEDLAKRVEERLPGIFSWADSQGCHSPTQDDEWLHAAFQITHEEGTINRILRQKIVALALTFPPSAHE